MNQNNYLFPLLLMLVQIGFGQMALADPDVIPSIVDSVFDAPKPKKKEPVTSSADSGMDPELKAIKAAMESIQASPSRVNRLLDPENATKLNPASQVLVYHENQDALNYQGYDRALSHVLNVSREEIKSLGKGVWSIPAIYLNRGLANKWVEVDQVRLNSPGDHQHKNANKQTLYVGFRLKSFSAQPAR